ncbi:unnamed protein product [Pedinophyceae sp. YPF-701]|nr:unnamed protein product [Pedinophyceae sp. YPF-701]
MWYDCGNDTLRQVDFLASNDSLAPGVPASGRFSNFTFVLYQLSSDLAEVGGDDGSTSLLPLSTWTPSDPDEDPPPRAYRRFPAVEPLMQRWAWSPRWQNGLALVLLPDDAAVHKHYLEQLQINATAAPTINDYLYELVTTRNVTGAEIVAAHAVIFEDYLNMTAITDNSGGRGYVLVPDDYAGGEGADVRVYRTLASGATRSSQFAYAESDLIAKRHPSLPSTFVLRSPGSHVPFTSWDHRSFCHGKGAVVRVPRVLSPSYSEEQRRWDEQELRAWMLRHEDTAAAATCLDKLGALDALLVAPRGTVLVPSSQAVDSFVRVSSSAFPGGGVGCDAVLGLEDQHPLLAALRAPLREQLPCSNLLDRIEISDRAQPGEVRALSSCSWPRVAANPGPPESGSATKEVVIRLHRYNNATSGAIQTAAYAFDQVTSATPVAITETAPVGSLLVAVASAVIGSGLAPLPATYPEILSDAEAPTAPEGFAQFESLVERALNRTRQSQPALPAASHSGKSGYFKVSYVADITFVARSIGELGAGSTTLTPLQRNVVAAVAASTLGPAAADASALVEPLATPEATLARRAASVISDIAVTARRLAGNAGAAAALSRYRVTVSLLSWDGVAAQEALAAARMALEDGGFAAALDRALLGTGAPQVHDVFVVQDPIVQTALLPSHIVSGERQKLKATAAASSSGVQLAAILAAACLALPVVVTAA